MIGRTGVKCQRAGDEVVLYIDDDERTDWLDRLRARTSIGQMATNCVTYRLDRFLPCLNEFVEIDFLVLE